MPDIVNCVSSSSQCVFCTHLQDETFDVVVNGSRIVAVYDRHPINRGHLLIIPRRHVSDLASLDAEEIAEMALLAQRCDRALRSALGQAVEGTNLLMSNGRAADQDVPHAHMHVIPRSNGDGYEFREDLTRYPLEPLLDNERRAISTYLEFQN